MLTQEQKMMMTSDELERISTIVSGGLDTIEKRFNSGDRMALMDAIALCASNDHPLPVWVRSAYLVAFGKVKGLECRSWDDALGKPFPERKGLSAARKMASGSWDVFIAVERIRRDEPGTPIDEYLFERVAEILKISTAQARKYYYASIRFT